MKFNFSLRDTFRLGMNPNILPANSLLKVVSSTACCSNDEVQKSPRDNAFDKHVVKVGLQCTESKMPLHDNCICSKYLKYDSSLTSLRKPVSAEVCHDLNNTFRVLAITENKI